MGVDHGLQGKEGSKKREERAKKAQRAHKNIGKVGLVIGKKKELVFNETARVEWLTGFHKRKQQRRQYGLTMGLLKQKMAKLDIRKQKRRLMEDIEGSNLEFDETRDKPLPATSSETCFNDDETNAMFGGDVSVVIDTGIVDALEEIAHPEGDGTNEAEGSSHTRQKPRHGGKVKTRFEKAADKAKLQMRHKPGRTGGKNRLQRSAKTRLLHKALGSGVLGSNEYKGNKKRKRKT